MPELHAQTGAPVPTPEIVSIAINGKEIADFASILRTGDGRIYIASQLVPSLRLRMSNAEVMQIGGDEYLRIDNLPDTHVVLDDATQTLRIVAGGSAFIGTIASIGGRPRRHIQAPSFGGYLNYDLDYSRSADSHNLGALLDANLFGVAGGEFQYREIYRQESGKNSVYRLDTRYARDFPDSISTLTIGDSKTGSSNWSNQVYFGGIQYSTNFSIRPDVIPTPLPTLSGVAQAPSTVNIYVNSVLRASTHVDSGPFALSNIPVFTGQGNVQMVVQDALGRQQVISQPFINSPLMLREGIHAGSFEAGLQHKNYGLASSSYSDGFASGTYRQGFSQFTAETHAEATAHNQNVGVGSTAPVFNFAVLTASVAGSRAQGASGGLLNLQLSHLSPRFGISVSDTVTSRNYWQLGYDSHNRPASHQLMAQGSIYFGAGVSLSVNYLNQANRRLQNVKAVAAGLSFDMRRYGRLSLSVNKALTSTRTLTAGVLWTIPYGNQSIATSEINFGDQDTKLNLGVFKSPDIEGGWGYRARTTIINNESQDVGVSYLGRLGKIDLSANHIAGQYNERLAATGGIAMLGGIVRPARWIDGSFAMAEVPLDKTVDVYLNNRVIGHTDRSGIAMLPSLVAYEENRIRLDDARIPLDVALNLSEHIVTPPRKGGYLIRFEAKKVTGATLILVDEHNRPIPAGAVVAAEGQASQQVARNGEVFMPDIVLPATVTVTWGTRRCTAKALAPASPIVLPTVGPFVCRE